MLKNHIHIPDIAKHYSIIFLFCFIFKMKQVIAITVALSIFLTETGKQGRGCMQNWTSTLYKICLAHAIKAAYITC